jgi:osmotically-inducible protein OsmY
MSGISRLQIGTVAMLAAMTFACGNRPEIRTTRNEPSPVKDERAISDAGITMRIDTTYMFNPHLSATAIDVDTDHGVVTLSGSVPSDVHRDLAVSIAKSADGVRDVHDRLSVDKDVSPHPGERQAAGRTFGEAVHDATITASIKMQLATGKGVAAHNINVDTRQGRVTLTGQVSSEAERQLAVRIARDTEGVREVENGLQVTRG